ncbi:hypothetical protein NLU13_2739 [Sarocladium strictum]|uniref:Amine oxidase n=1 Tax=Sarocladium strictum TaxID=5046 RepID=A0AA39L9T3_SARSR|nr:hypothetical protein NLU13_2739 [Sarocladium strictum]
MTSKDGYSWTEAQGLKAGVPSIGVIQPPTNLEGKDSTYDVIVVGAGYTGLATVRDATLAGLKVLLIEARDRIGGRSWSSNIDGYPYEMGGTWVYWNQPNVWREIARYDMQDDLESSYDFSQGINKFLLSNAKGVQKFTHEEEDTLMASALTKLINVDGNLAKDTVRFPHSATIEPSARKYDYMSVADRLREIGDDLSPNERACAEAWVLLASGATLETSSFYELLHWWALCDYSYEGCINSLIHYKFRRGQSSFAIRFFQEALSTGNLTYTFNSPVATIKESQNGVQVITRDGRHFSARKMVSSIPLNVLGDVKFDPPLSAGKTKAASIGHVNQTVKVHAEVAEKDLRSMTCVSYPHNSLIYGIADGTTPAGNTHVVAFGGSHSHFHPEDNVKYAIDAFKGFSPMTVQRLVFHNWSRDEFAKGAWFFSGPGLLADHLQDMRASTQHIVFACSDWAKGWRSFIDGAIEEGTRAAAQVVKALATDKSAAKSKL